MGARAPGVARGEQRVRHTGTEQLRVVEPGRDHTGPKGPDPDGVTAFRTHELRPGWVPPITRGQVVLIRPGRLPDRHPPLPSGQSLNPATTSHHARLSFTGHQQGFTHVHPSSLPFAHAAGMEPAALRLPPELRTPPSPAAHVRGRDRPSSTGLELPLNSHPSISNPVVHSMRATSRRTANTRCAAVRHSRPALVSPRSFALVRRRELFRSPREDQWTGLTPELSRLVQSAMAC